jgi:3-oxoadipate enol-lactonase/4-carboxymuconolactone decarboxylase
MADAVDLHHRLLGPPGAPVVALGSSIGTHAGMWDPQLPELSRRYRVLAFDHRGHGGSPVPPGPYDLADLGRDVLALLDRLELDTVAYCGLSLGGMVGMWLGIHAPERVSSLVLCCTSANLGPPDRWVERADLVRKEGTSALVEAMRPRWFAASTLAEQPALVDGLVQQLIETPDEGYAGCCAAIGGMDLLDEISAITAPTLVLCGAEDPATPVDMALAIHQRIAGSELVVIPRAAHLATAEQPERSTAAILAHLDGYQDARARGMAVRRQVLGEAHVDRAVAGTSEVTAPFQDFITRAAWGSVWSRPGLDRATRSAITLGLLTALGQRDELAMHVRAARRNGLTPEQISEVLLHAAVYCGVPAANVAFGIADGVLAEERAEDAGKGADDDA